MKKIGQFLGFSMLAATLILASCSSEVDESKAILSIWHIHSSTVNGIDIGDGKGWLHFKEDGTVESRTGPQMYDSGKFRIMPETKKLDMYTDTTSQTYDYVMTGDSLIMRAHIGEMALVLRTTKASEYPIKRIDDAPENFKPAPSH